MFGEALDGRKLQDSGWRWQRLTERPWRGTSFPRTRHYTCPRDWNSKVNATRGGSRTRRLTHWRNVIYSIVQGCTRGCFWTLQFRLLKNAVQIFGSHRTARFPAILDRMSRGLPPLLLGAALAVLA